MTRFEFIFSMSWFFESILEAFSSADVDAALSLMLFCWLMAAAALAIQLTHSSGPTGKGLRCGKLGVISSGVEALLLSSSTVFSKNLGVWKQYRRIQCSIDETFRMVNICFGSYPITCWLKLLNINFQH